MNPIKKFIRDERVGRQDFSTEGAAYLLEVSQSTIRHFVKLGILEPVEGGGRGQSYFFLQEDIYDLQERLEEYICYL